MSPLPILRRGLVPLLLAAFFVLANTVNAQEKDEDKIINQYLYKLRFDISGSGGIDEAKFKKITDLLNKHKSNIPADIQSVVARPSTESEPLSLTDNQREVLKNRTTEFFNEMAIEGLTMEDLQRYKGEYKKRNIRPGDNPLDPALAWQENYQSLERALMGGRIVMVMEVWKMSLIEFFRNHPEAVGVIYGQLDIGSWVKMTTKGLHFAADIDFSSLATNDAMNKRLVQYFETNLKKVSGLNMKQLDAPLTAHGQAGADVYIGEWGKVFAEKFGKIKLLEVVKNENGQVVDVTFKEVEGKEILFQKSFEQEKKALLKDPANNYEAKSNIELKMDMEPMFTLEMLRHAMTDAEAGPFKGGQKIIKMIKCTERSFTIQKEAGGADYKPNLTEPELRLRTLAEQVALHKDNPLKVAELLEAWSGTKIESLEQVDRIADQVVNECKKAMLKNAVEAFSFRIRTIAQIRDENIRFTEIDKFLDNLLEEFNKGFKKAGVDIPRSMQRARTILSDMRKGNVSPELMETRLAELNKLMEEDFKVDKSFVERLVGDAWVSLKKYFKDRGITGEEIPRLIEKFKQKVAAGWERYTPELVQDASATMYNKVNQLTQKCKAFDETLLQTEPGRKLHKALNVAGYVDMTFSLYDAYASGRDKYESAKNVGTAVIMILSQAYLPVLAVPFGIYTAVETNSIMPAIAGVMFYLFPIHFGGAYVVTNLLDRIVIQTVKNYDFRYHLDRMALMGITDGKGHVTGFKIPNKFTGLTGSPDSTETEPSIATTEPARTSTIKEVFNSLEYEHCPNIIYFKKLIPRKEDQFGMYNTKVQDLIKLFAFDKEMSGYMAFVLDQKKKKLEGPWPLDDFSKDRDRILDSMQGSIEDHFWTAVFNAIESTKKAEKEGVLAELEATIIRVQDSLWLDTDHMKEIDSLSLLLKIRKQVDNDPMYKQALQDKFSAGTAYERIAIPTLEYYIRVYRQIILAQKKIFEIWFPFGVDGSKLQDDPMRLLLTGGLSGSPMLTTNAERDIRVTIECLEAHRKKANDIRADLAAALGRPINEKDKDDKEHLKILGFYGFGFERLIDASPTGRSPDFKDQAEEINDINNRMKLFRTSYQDYLAKLKEGPALNVTLKLEAENQTTETNPVTAKVSILDKQNKVIPLPANTTLEWWLYDADTRKDVKVAEGATCTNDAAKQGGFTYSVRLIKKVNNKTTTAASTNWYLEVKRFDATDPKKGIVLKVPDIIKQYEIVDVSFTLPAALKGRSLKCNWGYSTIGKSDDCSGAKIQYNYELTFTDKDGKKVLRDSTNVDAYITVLHPGKTYGDVYNISKKVKFQHMSINVKASDIWTGGSGPNWFRIDRKAISNPPRYAGWMNDPAKKPRSTATAYATVGLKDDDPFETINTLDDLKALMEKKAKEQAFRKLEVKPVSVGDFKGYGLYSEPRYSRGSWSFEGYTSAGAGSSFSGYVMKGKKIFEVYWNAGASGAFDNSDQGWMMSMVKQLATEAAGILTAASFQPDGRLTKTPYTGPKLDGSDFPQVSIEPKVDTVLPGSKVMVKAVIKNDKPEYGPYTYNWSGNLEGAANAGTVQLESDRPGKKTISVNVDGTIPPGGASMEYVVAPLKVKITKISPPAQTIIVGMPVELRADFTGPVPGGKKLQYIWQPHPEEKFEPFEGAGNTTKVVFTKPGNKKVWVQVLDKTTAETITMGESDQLEFVVEKPAFTISFNPAKAKVGEMVVAKISSKPEKLEEVNYRWMPLPSNATLLKESQDGSEITFYAKDALQIPFEVLSLVKGSGEELGRTKGYFNAERYSVKAEGPKVQGPKPMIWKPGVGLVEVDKEIAVHQIVEFTTVVTPQPVSDLTYNWQVMEGNASVSNPTSRDARVTALETGNITLRVTVKDKNGVELGNATGAFNATISQEMISNANNQKKLFEDKMKQARQLMNEGKLDEAVKLGLELKGMNAKDAAPLLNELGAACKKDATSAATERDFDKAIKRCNQAIELNPNDTAAKKQLEDMKNWAQEWATVNAKGAELEGSITKKDLPSAEKALNELVKLQEKMPGQSANKWTAEKQKKYADLLNSCEAAFTQARNRFSQLYDGKDYEKALQELESFLAAWKALPATVKQIENVTGLCKTAISAQKKVYTDFQQIKSRFEQGQDTDPLKGPEYIEATAKSTFSPQDPRLKEMTDFARVMKNKQNETNTVKAQAEKLKAEGQQAEAAGDTKTAVRKYRESIALVPDPELEARIRVLETESKPPDDDTGTETGGLKLLAYYPFNGNANDESSTRRHGSIKNGAALTQDRFGNANSAYAFDGIDDFIEASATGLPDKDRTVMFWMKPAAGNAPSFPFTYGGGNGCGTSFLVGYNASDSKTYTTQGHCNTNHLATTPWALDPSNQWKHITVSISGKTIKFYINSILFKTTTGFTNPTSVNGRKLIIGGLINPEGLATYVDANGGYFKGSLDEVRIYRGAMTDEQVSAAFREQQQVKGNETGKPDEGVKPPDAEKEKKVFENGNIGGVSSGPPNPTKITFNTATFITRIENYHYFNRGVKPGTIALRHSNGTLYGPWQAYGLVGQGGVQNAYWDVLPNIEVPAGIYTVIDSDPSTWSYNSQSGGCGFTTVWTAVKGTATDKETWKGIFNVVWGVHAELQLVNGQYTGRMSVGGGSWETMEDLVIKDNKVSFHRANGNQFYTGTISGAVMKGTFTSGGRTGQNYNWELRREGAAISGTPPTKPGYTIEEVGGGVTAEQICIAGDIDNLGFGFPKGFDVFSGNSTPSHGYPWKIDPNDAVGTDRIMVGSGAKGNSDGYSGSTKRPDNMPVPITLGCNVTGINIRAAVLQLFVDDFQAPSFGSVFTATLNGRRAPFLETVLNSLSQTGPIGKLVSVNIPAEFLNEVKSGQLKLFIDDASSGRGDGFAIDFVRLVINPSSYTYTGTITGIVKRPDGQPAAGAVISAGGIISTTANNAGEFTLRNVPAGMVTVHASYNNHHHININTDLASGKTIKITINLPAD